MSNYDDILRKKEEEYSLNTDLQGHHWNTMKDLLKQPPNTPPGKKDLGNFINAAKIILVVGVVTVAGIWMYKHLIKTKKEFNGILKPSNIQSQFFTIDNNKDEIIHTSHASILKIKKGTFKTGKPVTIEVKEVFTPAEILQSGLTTTSDGKPLRSAGMIYFNATADGKNIEPSIPVDAFIPSKQKDTAMQVFKGEVQSDSTVNWTSPQPIIDTTDPKELDKMIAAGKSLYLSKCASCHKIYKDATGPALKNFQYRGPWKNPANIKRWINNSAAFMQYNEYTRDLKSKFGSMMTSFPDITNTDIANLLTYLNNAKTEEADTYSIHAKDTTEAYLQDTASKYPTESESYCGEDTTYYSTVNDFEEYDTTGFNEVFDYTDTINIAETEYDGFYKQGYDFKITNNGWYNIDAFLKLEDAKTANVSLSVEIVNGESLPYNVYVFVPTERVLQSYTTKKGNTYNFTFSDNKIPLPLRYRAVIFAFGSSGRKIMYGAAEFTIQQDQHIKVELKETTEEGLLNVLYTNSINGVEIKAIEKEMQITPRSCGGDSTPIVNNYDKK